MNLLAILRRRDLLEDADVLLIDRLRRRIDFSDVTEELSFVAVASALCRACAEGSLCLPLDTERLNTGLGGLLAAAEIHGEDPGSVADLSAGLAARFLQSAESGRFDSVLGSAEAPGPLVRAHGFLYLHRFYFAERTVAEGLARRGSPSPSVDAGAIDEILKVTLELRPLDGPDGPLRLTPLQQEALGTALRSPVFVLSGGPGTGKTTWTAAWLRAVLRLPGVTPDRIRLCAPTGRAARRLEESLRARLSGADGTDSLDPVDAGAHDVPVTTLHALLGYRAFEGRFARGPEDPLDADWILLDEASMADVFLLASLVRALRPGARLVLAGDPDQLPAVEAGSVLAELLPPLLPEKSPGPLSPRGTGPIPSVTLDTGHRARGEVAALAAAVRAGDGDALLASLGDPVAPDRVYASGSPVARVEPGSDPAASLEALLRAYAREVFSGYPALLNRFRTLAREDEPQALETLWKRAGSARVLAPLRRGAVSTEEANRRLRGLLEPEWRRPGDGRGTGFHGAPILVTRNDERAGLSNGDVGLWLETGDGAAVFFPRPNLAGGWLRVPVSLLPPHELGFASTVHKSQGSEYDAVLLLLPEAGNRLLARETLYTALTRARRGAQVFGSEQALREAAAHRLQRFSGLREWLQG